MNNKENKSEYMVDHQTNHHKEQQPQVPLKKRFCLRRAAGDVITPTPKPNKEMIHSYTIDSIPIFRQLSKHDIHRMNSAVSTTSLDMSGALDLLSFANAKGEEGERPSSELSLCSSSSSSSSDESDDQEQCMNVGNGERIYHLEEKDVLCGRGLGMTNHSGNIAFRKLIHEHAPGYRVAENSIFKNNIAQYVRECILPGRFLRRNRDTDKGIVYYELLSKKEVIDKVCQALRDVHSPSHLSLPVTSERNFEQFIVKPIPLMVTNNPESRPNDILFGRGGYTNNYPGNIIFRDLIRKHELSYLSVSKSEKATMIDNILTKIRSMTPPGRFLKKDTATEKWYDVGDERAREKISQALREKAPKFKKSQETNEVIKAPSKHLKVKKAKQISPKIVSPPLRPSYEDYPREFHCNQHYSSLKAALAEYISDDDVLCGRGPSVNNHIGNKRFRFLIKFYRPQYRKIKSRKMKMDLSRKIVNEIKNVHGGRFLKKILINGSFSWIEISDHKAYEKTSQALREVSPVEVVQLNRALGTYYRDGVRMRQAA